MNRLWLHPGTLQFERPEGGIVDFIAEVDRV